MLHYVSKEGEEGFPGNLDFTGTYQVTDNNELGISYEAETDQPTIINLTNHPFFNLNGEGCSTIANHLLRVASERYTPVDTTLIPTGELADLSGSPFDFRQAASIGARIDDQDQQLDNGKGYGISLFLVSIVLLRR